MVTAAFIHKNPPGLHERDLLLDDLKYIFGFEMKGHLLCVYQVERLLAFWRFNY